MDHSPLRRAVVCAGALLPLAAWALPALAASSRKTIARRLADLERQHAGHLGAVCLGDGVAIGYRARERFPLCSTFKLILAAAVLRADRDRPGLLEKRVAYGESDLLAWAPITRDSLGRGLTVGQLCAAAMQYSDNTAANLLMRELGGPGTVTRFARSLGDRDFRLDRWEPDLNSALPGDPRDTTTPAAMAASLRRLVLGDVLDEARRTLLVDWLKGNTTGDAGIRAGAPAGWTVGDKTGSGHYGTTNDVAVLWPPRGQPVFLALYFTRRAAKAVPRREVLAEAARIVLPGRS